MLARMLVLIILLCIFENQSTLVSGSNASGCKLPEHPANGKWKTGLTPVPSPGDVVSDGTVILVSCDEGYMASGTRVGLCFEQQFQWETKMAYCSKMTNGTQESSN